MSESISCSATNCVHNISALCSARKIRVDGSSASTSFETSCDTYAGKGFVNAVTNLTNMNIPGEFRQIMNTSSIEMSPKVECTARNCTFNQNETCNAESVYINGTGAKDSRSTSCETFIE
ncbi:MAG TPA: DUF1540 domain-containing protein [Clostridiaceae bacterium]